MKDETAAGPRLVNSAGGRVREQGTAYPRRPMALDSGTSADAAGRASATTLGLVRAAVLELLTEHAGTDEEISVRYNARVGHPRFPRVTDQRIRTARAELVREGLVRDSGAIAFSALGNRCTLWEVVAHG